MIVADHVGEWCRARKAKKSLGLVPTMGAFHGGHLSLIRRARAECDAVVVYVFVNPLQFGPREDLSSYPRDLERDLSLARDEGVDLLFTPTLEDMYPGGYPLPPDRTIHPGPLGETLEGASRPGHFEGVLTVVDRLFAIIGSCRAYFGEKDAQQLFLVNEMAAARHPGVEVVACPTVREPDGLALSSRNAYLSEQEHAAATCLYRGLRAAAARYALGERNGVALASSVLEAVGFAPPAELDYVAIVDPATFVQVSVAGEQALALIAARFGAARLIDNMRLDQPV